MKPFWVHSGLALLDVNEHGKLVFTDDFLRAYLRRAELALVPESCLIENRVHALLQQQPRALVSDQDIAQMQDPDIRDNWSLFIRFREYLMQAATLEDAYLNILLQAQAQGRVDVPPLFVEQLAHIVLHQAMVECEDGLALRVAELFYRDQQASLNDGHVLLADQETIETRADNQGLGDLGRLLAKANIKARDVDLDVLDADTQSLYFGRDEQHDFAIDLSHGRPAAERLCQVIAAWIYQLSDIKVRVRTLREISDHKWRWHIGLSAQGSSLLNALYEEQTLTPDQLRRIVWLGRLDFAQLQDQREDVRGKPVYLALVMEEDGRVRFKPQNLLLNLPLAVELGPRRPKVLLH
jgi:Family of unknown function (DUF6352)